MKSIRKFYRNRNGISAFVQKDLWDETILEDIHILESEEFKIDYTFAEIEPINWNEEWKEF
jgi:ribosomal protein L11 methyltransferase